MRNRGKMFLAAITLFVFSAMPAPAAAAPAVYCSPGTGQVLDDRLIIDLINQVLSKTLPPSPGQAIVTRGSYKIVAYFSGGGQKINTAPVLQQQPWPQTPPDPSPQPSPDPVIRTRPSPAPDPRPAPGPEPQPAPKPVPSGQGLSSEEQKMLDLVNGARASAGLRSLQADPALTGLARQKARDMIDRNYFSHTSPTYGSPFNMIKAAGITYRYAGENLAGAPGVDSAQTSLMNSPGHRANILNANYTRVGIGVVSGGPYGKMFVQMFTG